MRESHVWRGWSVPSIGYVGLSAGSLGCSVYLRSRQFAVTPSLTSSSLTSEELSAVTCPRAQDTRDTPLFNSLWEFFGMKSLLLFVQSFAYGQKLRHLPDIPINTTAGGCACEVLDRFLAYVKCAIFFFFVQLEKMTSSDLPDYAVGR